MIPTPEDRELAETFVATMGTPSVMPLDLDAPGHHGDPDPATPEQLWEFAFLLVAMVRKSGWTPPTKPVTPPAAAG